MNLMERLHTGFGIGVLNCLLVTMSFAQDRGAVTNVVTSAEQRSSSTIVTRSYVNGLFAELFLVDGDTNGGLFASRDEVTNTSSLQFSYASPDPTDSNLVILIQGVGEIPNSSFQITRTAAHLAVTTPFPVTKCIVNLTTGDFTCEPGTPRTFDLTWTKNGLGSVSERSVRVETFGPVTTKIQGEYQILLATVRGIWDGHLANGVRADLLDSQSKTMFREVTVKMRP
jgi:hypothetical protein